MTKTIRNNPGNMFCALMCAALLAACAMSPPEGSPPDLTFAQVRPVSLNVAKIEIVDAYRMPMQPPHVEHLFRESPAAAARTLIGKQLTADGADNLLRVFIEDASVVRKALPVDEGWMGIFNREPSERYDARVSLRFELSSLQAPDISTGHATVIATRSKGVLQDASPAEVERAFFELTESLMNDVSAGLQTVVRDTFGRM